MRTTNTLAFLLIHRPHLPVGRVASILLKEKQKTPIDEKLSIYMPQSKMGKKSVERFIITLNGKRDRPVNYLVT